MTAGRDGAVKGLVFDIDTFAVHDGPGIRMAVYLKGCPLACRWCHSPESRLARRELIFVRDRCAMCRACEAACRAGVHQFDGGNHVLARDRCAGCGVCVENCPSGALQIKGYVISVDKLVARAVRMKPFFDHSGGGLTLTGGEVAGQADFAVEVLSGCRDAGIHTAIETAGACGPETLERLVEAADLVLYDLKLIDDGEHRRWTGVSNEPILENARRLAGRSVQIRVPLIPGITDTTRNLSGIFEFMRSAGLTRAALLPFNPSAGAKYEWLGERCEIEGTAQTPEKLAELVAMAGAAGLEAVIG